MATQNLWYYREQLYRIIEEGLEISLILCNTELGEFTVAKIFDIFNQVLPTGFVLNTGYWPFYNSLKKQSICVCARYGIDCRHFKHDYHWIDLDDLPSDQTKKFSTRSGTLSLLNSEIELIPITGSTAGYSLNIKLTFQYKKIERGRPRRKRDENFNINPDELFQALICSRYILQREYYPALHTIMFQPSPFFYESYGNYFPKLLQARDSPTHFPPEINQRFYTVPIENMPHFTLLLQFVNLPVHQYSKTIVHAIYAHLDPPKIKRMSYSKTTQTNNSDESEVWRYKELIGNLKTLWNDSKSSSCESLFPKPATNNDISFGTFIFNDINVVSQCSITESQSSTITDSIKSNFDGITNTIKKEIEEKVEQECPTSTTEDNEFDAQWPQWGYQKVVTKKRGRKRFQSVQVFGDTLADSRRRINPLRIDKFKTRVWHNSKYVPMPTYATIVKASKPPYNDDPDFQWLDNQFPDVLNCAAIKQENMDEEFDIAEEFINQEKERENIRRCPKQIS